MSSIHRFQSTWRTITFNPHLDNSGLVDDPAHLVKASLASRYILDSVDINRVSAQDYRELRQFLEGAEPNEAFEGVRSIVGMGRIQGTSPGDLEDKAWALNEAFSIAACRVAAAATTPKGVLPYDFRRASAASPPSIQLRFYCRPGPARPVWVGRRAEGLIRPFSFQLLSFDPFAVDQAEVQTNLTTAGGNVTNPGNVYARPRIRIVQTGLGNAAFTITNTTTGKALVLDLSALGAGTNIEIDVAKGTIASTSGLTNRYSTRVSGFATDQFLLAGVNALTFANGANVSQIQFFVRGAYA